MSEVTSTSACQQILTGDCLDVLSVMEDGVFQACVTSPPYFGLRDYGLPPTQWPAVEYATLGGVVAIEPMECCLGRERAPHEFVGHLVHVFREVRRVLRDDGTVWLNLGDTYAANRSYQVPSTKGGSKHSPAQGFDGSAMRVPDGMKAKDLMGVPWMVAFALRADDWWLRNDVIWHKPNAMPSSVRDRLTTAHEYVFLLAKSASYFYDASAIKEPHLSADDPRNNSNYQASRERNVGGRDDGYTRTNGPASWPKDGRNKRSVWTIPTSPFPDAHFAVFPPKLIEPCVLAGSREGDTVLDPFAGAGTTGVVCRDLGRSFVGLEMSEQYAEIARERILASKRLVS